jgi:amino acid transporter
VKDPQRTVPRDIFASGTMIAIMYIGGTVAVLMILPSEAVDTKSGVFQAVTQGSALLRMASVGVIAALLVTVGNTGGVGSTVAGVARIPFIVGIDRYLPAAFGKIHPKWRTPYISILVQAGVSGVILLLAQINENMRGAYQILVDAATILYFIPFLYMYAATIKLYSRPDRRENRSAVVIPGGRFGVLLAGGLGLVVVVAAIVLSFVPPGDSSSKFLFETKLVLGTVLSVALGLVLYYRGARLRRLGG